MGQLGALESCAAACSVGKISLISCCIHTLTWCCTTIPATAYQWNAGAAGKDAGAAGEGRRLAPRTMRLHTVRQPCGPQRGTMPRGMRSLVQHSWYNLASPALPQVWLPGEYELAMLLANSRSCLWFWVRTAPQL